MSLSNHHEKYEICNFNCKYNFFITWKVKMVDLIKIIKFQNTTILTLRKVV